MATDLAKFAKSENVRYFLISFTDLFGVQRSKLVPAQAIGDTLDTVVKAAADTDASTDDAEDEAEKIVQLDAFRQK